MAEFELKFQVPAQAEAALEARLQRGKASQTRLRARYFDTPDEALARAGLVLRLRQEDSAWIQAVKGRGNGGFERLEHEVPVEGDAQTLPDPSLHASHPAGKALRKALAGQEEALQCVYETDITRLSRTVEAGETIVEVAFDRGHLLGGGRQQAVREIEFELKSGSPAAAVELARAWCEEHRLWLDPMSKAAAARRLARDAGDAAPVHAAPVVQADHPAALVAAMLDSALAQVLGNARELAAGTGRDGHIHQLRVGLRRLRTLLREREVLGDAAALEPAVEEAIKALFARLGEHRDRSTLLPALQDEMAAAGSPAARWQPPLPDVGAAVREPALQSALLQMVAHAEQLRASGEDHPRRAMKATRKAVGRRLGKLHRRVVDDGRHFEALEVPLRHALRKRLKRLRYLAEFARPLYRRREVEDYLGALKSLQDALGSYQDATTGRALFEQRSAEDPQAWFAVGWLAAREAELAAQAGQACRRTRRKARPFWD